jgi:threonine synthase
MLQCVRCKSQFLTYPLRSTCKKCGGSLEYVEKLRERAEFSGSFGFWRYRNMLPIVNHVVSLGEGGTPLHKAERLAKTIGVKELFLKDETRNPTNSYRDRAAALLTSNAVDLGCKSLICATNGNLGASLAAYSAKANLSCNLVVPKVVDVGKLAQMLAYDATIEEFGDILDESIPRAAAVAEETGWYQATAELNPLVIEAQKTISYEVFEQYGVPEWVFVPMGSGGTIYSVWKGFKELKQLGLTKSLPKMVGVQSEGCASIVNALTEGLSQPKKIENAFTRALAILMAAPLQGELAVSAVKESGGSAVAVSDSEIVAAELEIAKLEGMFAEPASAAVVSALRKVITEGKVNEDNRVVCLITGSGLKATDVLQALTKKQKTAVLGRDLSTKEKLLRELSEKETYGYELWKKLGKVMTRAAVYQHLSELSEKGLIVAHAESKKKVFKITERGKKVLRAIDDLKLLM